MNVKRCSLEDRPESRALAPRVRSALPVLAESAEETVRLTPGAPIGDPIPLEPGGWSAFRDSGKPTSAQQVMPADPRVAEIVLGAANAAYADLGLDGPFVVAFFTAEDRPGGVILSDAMQSRFHLEAFMAGAQTDPPSIWIRLDDRAVTAADLRHLVRHEMGHYALERAGMQPGQIAEALADEYASGGMAAVQTAFGRGAIAPRHLNAGTPLAIAAPSGSTVIIDGTSMMFKIQTAPTYSYSHGAASGDTTPHLITLTAITPGATPAIQSYVNFDNSGNTGWRFPSTFDAPTAREYVATVSGGTGAYLVTVKTVGHQCAVHLNGSGQVELGVWCSNADGITRTFYGKVYVLKEAAL